MSASIDTHKLLDAIIALAQREMNLMKQSDDHIKNRERVGAISAYMKIMALIKSDKPYIGPRNGKLSTKPSPPDES